MSKVIHVHLIFEKKNIYFGSISAIFETLTEQQVGITKNSLLHAGLVDDIAKYTKRAMIIQSRLITCTRKGWNSLRTSIKPLFAAFFVFVSVIVHQWEAATYFERFEQSENWKGLHLGLQVGFTFSLLQKRNASIGFTLGFTFLDYFFVICLYVWY